jgi:hypothetical protein
MFLNILLVGVYVANMAYVRDEKETVEIDFPIDTVWATIKKTVDRLGWTIDKVDESAYQMQVKTKKAFLSYASTLSIDAKSTAENITRLAVTAETPVTTITSVLDFGKSQERIDLLLQALSIELNSKKAEPKQE